MDTSPFDTAMMQRAIALSVHAGEEGEYPYGVVIARDGKAVTESINRVAHEQDVTRHAEVVAISAAQKALDTVSLDDCTIYMSAEPCVYCCYAIRESRIGRVVYGAALAAHGRRVEMAGADRPGYFRHHAGGVRRAAGYPRGLHGAEAEAALLKWNPVVAGAMKLRGLFVAGPLEAVRPMRARKTGARACVGISAPQPVRSLRPQLGRARSAAVRILAARFAPEV